MNQKVEDQGSGDGQSQAAAAPKSKGVFVTEGAEFSIHGLQISWGPEGFKVSHEIQ